MGTHQIDKDLLKQILKQINGNVGKNEKLLPEVSIKGERHMWCYDIIQHKMVRVACAVKCYIMDDSIDERGRVLVYTLDNNVILVEESKIIYTGYD